MAEVVLRLITDPKTGRKVVDVHLHSDPDALPMEHEDQHRQIVQGLAGSGLAITRASGHEACAEAGERAEQQAIGVTSR